MSQAHFRRFKNLHLSHFCAYVRLSGELLYAGWYDGLDQLDSGLHLRTADVVANWYFTAVRRELRRVGGTYLRTASRADLHWISVDLEKLKFEVEQWVLIESAVFRVKLWEAIKLATGPLDFHYELKPFVYGELSEGDVL